MRYSLSPGAASSGALAVIGGGTTIVTTDADLWGWAAIIIGVLVWLWAFSIDGKPWWSARKKHQQGMPNWIPMHKALLYLALNSRWAYEVGPASASQLDKLLEREFLEHLANGDLKARGQETRNFTSSMSATTVSIEPTFWETAFIRQLYTLLSRPVEA